MKKKFAVCSFAVCALPLLFAAGCRHVTVNAGFLTVQIQGTYDRTGTAIDAALEQIETTTKEKTNE